MKPFDMIIIGFGTKPRADLVNPDSAKPCK
jgi:hypothetical protein